MGKYHLKSEEALLLIIDLQEKLLAAMSDREQVVKNTNILIEMAQVFGLPVVVTEQYPQGLGRTVPEIWSNCTQTTLIEKMMFSAYTPELVQYLKDCGRRQIIVVGTETHVCVYQTVRELLNNDFSVFLCADAVTSRYSFNYQNGLDLMKEMGTVVTNTETVLFDLLQVAGTPEFKRLSKLVK